MYQKLISYGDTIEHYRYDRSPSERQNASRNMASYRRTDVSNAERMVKRQDNAKRARMAFGRLAVANFRPSERAVFATLTFKENQSIQNGYKLFNLFAKRLRYEVGTDLRYIAVPEFGQRNTQRLHFHALFWNLDLEKVKQERATRHFAKIWRYGFVDLVITDNNPKVGYYLSKYLQKTYLDNRFFNKKSYITSRNLIRPEVSRSFVSMILDYEVGVDNLVLHDHREYDTVWLGKCNFKLYKNCLKKPNIYENQSTSA